MKRLTEVAGGDKKLAMTREEWQPLSVAELVEMVQQLQATVQQLQARIRELEAQVARPKKTPANSSVPPAKGYKANRPASAEGAAKRGPNEGHPGTTRAAAQPDVEIVAKVERCDRCGQELARISHTLIESENDGSARAGRRGLVSLTASIKGRLNTSSALRWPEPAWVWRFVTPSGHT